METVAIDRALALPREARGFCGCGCGQQTNIANRNRKENGWVKGQPIQFVNGHCGNHDKLPRKQTRYIVDPISGCWNWALSISRYGYGQDNGKRAHKAMWEAVNGPVPNGKELDHLCRNRRCVNPSHLEPVTRAVNVRRGRTTKLSPNAVAEIIERYNSGESMKDLATSFKVTLQNIHHVVRGKTWKS